MLKYDVRNYSDEERAKLAWALHQAPKFNLHRLRYWNYDLCRQHRQGWVEDYFDKETGEDKKRLVTNRPSPGCRKCGIHFREHQKLSIMWMYLAKRGLLADTMGTGKTTSAAGLIALMMETGELGLSRSRMEGTVGRAIIIPRSPALSQWQTELKRMVPAMNVQMVDGSMDKKKRQEVYAHGNWEVLLIGPEMFRNDYDNMLERFDLSLLLTDDIDQLRNPDTDTSYYIDRAGERADRYFIMTGTPLQKRLPELYSVLDGVGGRQAFGTTLEGFIKRHVRYESYSEVNNKGETSIKARVAGYRNLDVVKRQMAPLVLRRTAADLKDVNLPTIIPTDVMLDLYPAQRRKYKELQTGVLKILKDTGTETKHTTALSKLHYGAAICGGLATLGEEDGPNTSVKMDWIIEKVSDGGDLGDEKVVVFANYKTSIRALQHRFREAGIGFETVWGEQPDARERKKSQDRFWEDPSCRILLGTRAIEQSLNLQVARHLINMDMILNPARMEQLAGRIRRDGSAFQHVFVHNLLTINTQEERYIPLMEREAALSAHMWDEDHALFPNLSPMVLLQLIAPH